jgi:hypothetical protein
MVVLQEIGLVREGRRHRGADIGDMVVWDGTWYRTDNVHRTNYFIQTDHNLFTGLFCNRYHHNNDSPDCNSPTPACDIPLILEG